jgi:D-beta-D-heptose 7-phosphate kinase/D-beta-D-heptose 1-phosphate adenosyltransferase
MTVAPGRTRQRTEHQYREDPATLDCEGHPADSGDALARLAGARVLVVGDVMLDRFVQGAVKRISPEAPAPILRVDREWAAPGGAGNLARNLAALGARCRLLSVVGTDDAARQVRDLLDDDPNIECRLIAADGRRTSVKERHLAQGRLLLRADRETADAVSPALAQSLTESAHADLRDAGAVVLSDYAKGVLSAPVVRRIISEARRAGKPVVVDPKGLDFGRYRGADLVTPNRGELAAATGLPTTDDGAITAAGRRLIERAGIAQVLATRSEDGMTLVRGDGSSRHFRARARQVFDVAGAGDTVAAVMAAGLAVGVGPDVAAALANAAAGVVVGKPGTAVATPDEIREAIESNAPEDHRTKIADRR